MRHKFTLLISSAFLGICAATTALAADATQTPAQQNFAATIALGYEYTDFNEAEDDEGIIGNTGFAEGAFLFSNLADSNFNIQIDGSYYLNDLSNHDNNGSSVDEKGVDRWHGGGVLFWRDATIGLLGIDGAYGQQNWSGDKIDDYRVGARFEYYPSDFFTLGGRAGYIHEKEGSHDKGADGFYANGFGEVYATENWAFTGSVDYAYFSKWDKPPNDKEPLTIWAFTAETEYDLSTSVNRPISIFAGGRYTDQDDSESTFNEIQGFVGLKWYFGGGDTLAAKHRNNTLDNLNTPFDRVINREGT